MTKIPPDEALLLVIAALGFQVTADNKIVHSASGRALRVLWNHDAAKDLRLFQGEEAVYSIATVIMKEVWSVATRGLTTLADEIPGITPLEGSGFAP